MGQKVQRILSLPEAMANIYHQVNEQWFAVSDPRGVPLGSGGGTAYVLYRAWQNSHEDLSFREWLRGSSKLIVHGGGMSRRLPAYAVTGKPLIPIPVLRNTSGQRFAQTWIDVQSSYYESLMDWAGSNYVVMVTSGDVLLNSDDQLPPSPDSDIIALGMKVQPREAQQFGVFFTKHNEQTVDFFLQKPKAEEISSLSTEREFFVDTGMWLMSEDATMALMTQCGWNDTDQSFIDVTPRRYELYAGFGLSLGNNPRIPDDAIGKLSTTVVSLPKPEFYHLGTSRDIIQTFTVLQNRDSDLPSTQFRHPDRFIINSRCENLSMDASKHTLWIENSVISSGWNLHKEHVITGVPENTWDVDLESGVCLDFVPYGEEHFCLRVYGIDDRFSGKLSETSTKWLGRPAVEWFESRSLNPDDLGLDLNSDIQEAKLFPVLSPTALAGAFIEWMTSARPVTSGEMRNLYMRSNRISAEDLRHNANVGRLLNSRDLLRCSALKRVYDRGESGIFHRLDLSAAARSLVPVALKTLSDEVIDEMRDPMVRVHERMFQSALAREKGELDWQMLEVPAFDELRKAILAETSMSPSDPECCVLEDQIIWGRSPARLDIAGGWSDTPPYCIEHGGKVVNIAVNLNGQPPIQVFARRSPKPELVIRSIDLGVEARIHTYQELGAYALPGSEFALARAALAIAGFMPEFRFGDEFSSLERQLEAFGGGIELSLLAAIPQGSGLGTSSILGATLLGVLSEFCGLGWDRHELILRTLAVEQMLTTGGGWQDQAGAVFGGLKLVETSPGLRQTPVVRWLPEHLFESGFAGRRMLLYYTGITRLAKNILQEIVRGMFLNTGKHLENVRRIHRHGQATFEAIQRNDYDSLCRTVARSWNLNKILDSGTNPPEVEAILESVSGDLAAAKLLGAGGGGYILMLARDSSAGERIVQKLTQNPPNSRARFVDASVSRQGLEITRS